MLKTDEIESVNTRFRDWVYSYGGTLKLSKALRVHQNSVQGWIARRSRPTLDSVLGILMLSRGAISLKDIDEAIKLIYPTPEKFSQH